MIGLLGRGGMGEVYRADDLKLGQPVALKFLPGAVEQHPDRLERFLNEVRLSHRVTHPNVCRVFDVVQADGRQFLSMEYVDGEDLASLLRRIGHLPEDKALQIARQLCAGLAAAHDVGVLHRDLKPANVMVDGRGRAKITDFGLAGATEGIRGLEARVGTPEYMAPEQRSGQALTERTDLYALGLVLFELFTGKRANDAKAVGSSDAFRGLDPAIERAIVRCLDPDPARRPASALAVAAALPGGDPLAMALAAGETPSPEMVAVAGGRGELSLPVASACLAVVLLGLLGVWFVRGRTALENLAPMTTPPAELAVAARSALDAAGYTAHSGYRSYGFTAIGAYFSKVEADDRSLRRWDKVAIEHPSPVRFWYRESPAALAPSNNVGRVGPGDPPLVTPGMTRVYLDPDGALQQLLVVPPAVPDATNSWPEPDWKPLLSAARLDLASVSSAAPLWLPPVATDLRRAWTSGDRRVEAGAVRGRIVWFYVVPSWQQAPAAADDTLANIVRESLVLIGLAAGIFLARRNLLLGRSDSRGARRVAAAYFALGLLRDLLRFTSLTASFQHLMNTVGLQMFGGALVWVMYVALEPYVRRLWPDTLSSWSRVVEGRFRDPLVGRHVLVGAVGGVIFSALFLVPDLAAPFTGIPPSAPHLPPIAALGGPWLVVSEVLFILQGSIFLPVVMLLCLLVLRLVLRRTILVYAALTVIALVLAPRDSKLDWLVGLTTVALMVAILTRFGLLAFLSAIVFSTWEHVPLTTNTGSWFFAMSAMTMAAFAVVAVYAFVVSLGGLAFNDPVLES